MYKCALHRAYSTKYGGEPHSTENLQCRRFERTFRFEMLTELSIYKILTTRTLQAKEFFFIRSTEMNLKNAITIDTLHHNMSILQYYYSYVHYCH